jgi:AraC-like DNA-binding protein
MDLSLTIQVLLCYKTFGVDTWSNKNRSAPFWRLYWNANEGASLSLGKTVVLLGPEKLVLIPPNTPFDKHTKCEVHHFFIHFTMSYSSGQMPPGLYEFPITAELKKSIMEAISFLNAGQSETPRFLLLSNLIVAKALCAMSDKIQTPVLSDPRLVTVNEYMDANLGNKLVNADLAQLVGMNTNAFIHFFKQKMDMTPKKYFESKRFQKACNLLKYSNLSIDHIAESTGFCDRNHFTKAFIRSQKVGPGEFRRKALMND